MPQSLPRPILAADPQREVTSIYASKPIGGVLTGNVTFTVREEYTDGSHFDYHDGSVGFTLAELAALPSFAAFYAELRDAAYAKRAANDPTP